MTYMYACTIYIIITPLASERDKKGDLLLVKNTYIYLAALYFHYQIDHESHSNAYCMYVCSTCTCMFIERHSNSVLFAWYTIGD